jgi:hypothetical protein
MTPEEQVRELQRALLDAEQRLARVGELELELREVTTRYDAALQQALHERDEARELLERARRVEDDMKGSVSWRVTAPLRSVKRR